jgi:predicted nucleotidyltransferase
MAQKFYKKHLNALKKVLLKHDLPWSSIYLFGSVAKGFATDRSDIDLCVVLADGVKSVKAKEIKIMGEIGLAQHPLDLIFVSHKDYHTHFDSPILHEIRTTGQKVA